MPSSFRIPSIIPGNTFFTGVDLYNRAVTFASAVLFGPSGEIFFLSLNWMKSGDSAMRFVLRSCLKRYFSAVAWGSSVYCHLFFISKDLEIVEM